MHSSERKEFLVFRKSNKEKSLGSYFTLHHLTAKVAQLNLTPDFFFSFLPLRSYYVILVLTRFCSFLAKVSSRMKEKYVCFPLESVVK